MQKIKILIFLLLITLLAAGCDLKIDINPKSDEASVNTENQEQNDVASSETPTVPEEPVKSLNSEEQELLELSYGDVVFKDFAELCGQSMMLFAQPADQEFVILAPFNPGSDQPLKSLYKFSLTSGSCTKMEISQELSDFGARVLSPNQDLLALALETDEAKELKLIDLVNDKSLTLVELGDGETLNAGYGAMSNHFDIKWLDDQKIQYTVFEDTVENYSKKAPDELEKVIGVKVLDIE